MVDHADWRFCASLVLYELSLSLLNHWLPWIQAHPEVVQGTTEFHHQIADAFLPQTDPVFHNATTLHTALSQSWSLGGKSKNRGAENQ